MSKSGTCHHCGRALSALEYGRQDICPGCRRDTRVCRNCLHFDPSLNNQCRENQAERVVDKDRSNFCDYFSPIVTTASGAKSAQDIKSAAEALFKKRT